MLRAKYRAFVAGPGIQGALEIEHFMFGASIEKVERRVQYFALNMVAMDEFEVFNIAIGDEACEACGTLCFGGQGDGSLMDLFHDEERGIAVCEPCAVAA